MPLTLQPQPVLSREQYIQKITALQELIRRGDCYEINFCQEFFAGDVTINPFAVFQKLMDVSPNPFSALYRLNDKYLICASPERFLSKEGNKILSQPMKGTIKRVLTNKQEDEKLKEALRQNQKEQSENVMVVDLVRNDLTNVGQEDSGEEEETYGIYSFSQVHQMVSTMSGELRDGRVSCQIIAGTFPMCSMSGAPKHRVSQVMDAY